MKGGMADDGWVLFDRRPWFIRALARRMMILTATTDDRSKPETRTANLVVFTVQVL